MVWLDLELNPGLLDHWRTLYRLDQIKGELICDVLKWTPTHGHTSVNRPAKTYMHHLCASLTAPRKIISLQQWSPIPDPRTGTGPKSFGTGPQRHSFLVQIIVFSLVLPDLWRESWRRKVNTGTFDIFHAVAGIIEETGIELAFSLLLHELLLQLSNPNRKRPQNGKWMDS